MQKFNLKNLIPDETECMIVALVLDRIDAYSKCEFTDGYIRAICQNFVSDLKKDFLIEHSSEQVGLNCLFYDGRALFWFNFCRCISLCVNADPMNDKLIDIITDDIKRKTLIYHVNGYVKNTLELFLTMFEFFLAKVDINQCPIDKISNFISYEDALIRRKVKA